MSFFKPKFWDKNKISFLSILLLPITIIVSVINFCRHFFTKTYQFSIPVICVGNIYLGGTGKTPLCIEIFSILKDLNMNPAFIRKKYKDQQDEAELQKQVGPIFLNKKRTEAINSAIHNKFNVVVLDDGFQDLSVKKNLSFVCFNENQWIGNGFTIPSGPLRESLSTLKKANCVVINGNKNIDIEKKILEKNKLIKIFYCKYKAQNIDNFYNKNIIAFAGIGNPINFFDLLYENNLNILEKIEFPDHYNYTKKDLDSLIVKSKNSDAILLTTEKDYLRINKDCIKNFNYLKINIEIEKRNQFINELKKII
tara:strand:- start:571 stop:1500 length:930 start_codon:yes stop_codon:yes gene_type:complete